MDNHEWFKQAGYGMMVHWGLYSLLGGQYGEQIVRPYAEWIQAQCAIPIADYSRLAGVFNPIYFDADEWIRLAKDCGMKYFVITSKHHDGFAMFHSRVDKYNVVDATPFGRDVVGELANACAPWSQIRPVLLAGPRLARPERRRIPFQPYSLRRQNLG